MEFFITLSTGSINFLLRVSLVERNGRNESFKISPVHNADKFVIIQNNRPYIRDRLRLKNKPIIWSIKEGIIKNDLYYKRMLKEIEKVLEPGVVSEKGQGSLGSFRNVNRKKMPGVVRTLGERKYGT